MRNKSESGIGHLLLLLLILVVIVIVGLVGYRVKHNHEPKAGEVTVTQPVAKAPVVPNTINSQADLSEAEAALNQTNIDGDMNPDSLNADVSSLL